VLTSASKDEEIDTIYDHLEKMLDKEKVTEYVILMGDWNAVQQLLREGKDSGYVKVYCLSEKDEKGPEVCVLS